VNGADERRAPFELGGEGHVEARHERRPQPGCGRRVAAIGGAVVCDPQLIGRGGSA
jgi:hypothetical protein